ncbi:MAG: tetratricopeptide repeat protein [Acidobacteria bacterium]|nr:tetratricopeptide repeat protein [Acidobacteriota bacterium]
MKTVRLVFMVSAIFWLFGAELYLLPVVRTDGILRTSLNCQTQSPESQSQILKPGEKQTHLITLKVGDLVNAVVEQQGIDIVVRLVSPDGTVVTEVDNSSPTEGPETLTWVMETGGTFQLEIESVEKDAAPGTYVLKLDPPRPATETERARVEIEKISYQVQELFHQRKYDQAITLAQQVLELAEKALGPDHSDVGDCLNNLAALYWGRGNYDKAEPLFIRALAITEQNFGPEHPDTVVGVNNLAQLYRAKGDFAKAAPLYQRSLVIREKLFGTASLEVSESLNSLGMLNQGLSNYSEAETLLTRALAIREKKLGADHPDVGKVVSNLASLYFEIGKYTRAEPLFLQAIAIDEKAFGPNHPNAAGSLNDLAGFYQARAEYTKAEPLFQRSLAIWEKAVGPNHPEVALSLNNLADLYWTKGDFARAEPLFVRSLAIREKTVGPNHPDVAVSLNNLASVYMSQKDYAKAGPLFQRSLAIREKVFGPEHPSVARALDNLAGLYRRQGDREKMEPLMLRALAIREKTLDADHPELAYSLNRLGWLYKGKGDYQRAESLFLRDLAISEKAFGPDHPEVAKTLNSLAELSQGKGEIAKAIAYRVRGNDTTERDLVRNLVAGSENQKMLYLKTTDYRTDETITLHVQSAPQNQAALQAALTVILRRKGRSLDAASQSIELIRQRASAEDKKLLDELTEAKSELSRLTLRGPGKEGIPRHQEFLKELEVRADQLEGQVNARSAEYRSHSQPITLEAVQKAIPANAALIEFALYKPYDLETQTYGNWRYVAYVIPGSGHGKQGSGFRVPGSGPTPSRNRDQKSNRRVINPRKKGKIPEPGTRNPEPGTLDFEPGTRNPEPCSWVDLGEAEPIDQVVSEFRKVLSDRRTDIAKDVTPIAQVLDALVMKPVRKLIGLKRHLLISPDGALNLVPFSALMDEQGKYLVENYTLTYLTSGRDLLRLGVNFISEEPVLVIANPDYAQGSGPVLAGQAMKPLLPLPGTEREGKEIQKLLPGSRLVVQGEATKEIVKQVHRPEMLHIATHGYFLEDAPEEFPTEDDRRLQSTDPINLGKLHVDNPLLRSWLFFASANQGNEKSNGVLTALEASQLDLWGTRLVVLSACDTGLGEVKNGDGVFGLRRALVLAGSEAQMMSLWAVSDTGTRELMTEYYRRLKAGEGRSEALRNTQLKLLKDPKRQHPFYWASFIQSGEWRPLERKQAK